MIVEKKKKDGSVRLEINEEVLRTMKGTIVSFEQQGFGDWVLGARYVLDTLRLNEYGTDFDPLEE